MGVDRHVSRAVGVAVGSLFAVATIWVSPAAAAGSGAGFMDGKQVVTSEGPNKYLVTYPVMYFYGHLEVAGQTYDGGFYVTGATATHEVLGGGQCYGVCDPISGSTWKGRDAGTVYGFDPNPSAVTGQCMIVQQVNSTTGPFYAVEFLQTMTIACTVSVLGSPPSTFSLSVVAERDQLGDVVGAYTVS